MFTLLPEKEKKALSKEYLWRFLTVTISAITVAVLIAIVLLLPSFFFSKEKAADSLNEQKNLESSALFSEESGLLATLKTVRNETILGKTADAFPTKVVEDVISHEPSSISISNFQYRYDPSSSTLVVTGTESRLIPRNPTTLSSFRITWTRT